MDYLSKSEVSTLLTTLSEAIPDIVFFKDPSGAYVYANTAFERLYGYTLDQLKGKTDFDFLTQEQAQYFTERDQEALAADKKLVSEAWQVNELTDQNECYETTKVPVHGKDGKLLGLLGVVRNVTALRLAEALLKQGSE